MMTTTTILDKSPHQEKVFICDLLNYYDIKLNLLTSRNDKRLVVFKVPPELEQHEIIRNISEVKIFVVKSKNTEDRSKDFVIAIHKKDYGYFCGVVYGDEKDNSIIDKLKSILKKENFSDLPLEEYFHSYDSIDN